MHASSPGERVAELARRARDPVLVEVPLQAEGLVLRVVLLLPLGERLAADPVVGVLPLEGKIGLNLLAHN